MNVVSCSQVHSQGPDFEKRARQDCASAIVETATSTVNKVRCSVAEAVSVAVYCDTLVSACRADEFACDSRPGVSAISLARSRFVAARPRRSQSVRSQIFVAAVACYLVTVKLGENVTVMRLYRLVFYKKENTAT